MKKSKYISKYDFINYYAKPKGFWFFTNAEIDAAIQLELNKLKVDQNQIENEDENEQNDFDAFEAYQEILSENEDIDLNNPLLMEGNIIDQNSRKHIISLYNQDFQVIDLDLKYRKSNNELKAKITLDLISQHSKLILFQSVFISQINGIDVITKPDAIVIENGNFYVYETKGTSTTKKHHLLDLYFQAKVIESIKQLNFNFEYFLCIVAFELANARQCPLIASAYCNIGKAITFDMKKWNEDFDSNKVIEYGQSIKMGEWTSKIVEYDYYPFSITKFINHNLIELQQRLEAPKQNFQTKKSIMKFQEDALKMFNQFETILKQLHDHKLSLNDQSQPLIDRPGYGDKSEWKDSDTFMQTKVIYAAKGYDLLKYSGNIIQQTYDKLQSYQLGNDLSFFQKKSNYNNYFPNDYDVVVARNQTKKFIQEIKNKKVYFDFETINSAIRAFDNTLPFRQIITQSSVVVDHNDGSELKCQNLIIDPLKIDQKWFKAIVDSLHYGNDYSYIVYNKSFEKSRLNEMKDYINDLSYSQKIDNINNNMVDLADLFDVRKPQAMIFEELYGFYSIKKVLPLVQKYDPDIFEQVKCLDYKALKINNGKLCQDKTAERFFNLLNDEDWNGVVHDLKVYCENDVRAMIAVEYFARKLLTNKYSNLKINFQ